MIVPAWSTDDEFRRLEDAGLTMFGQMTAASWFYIGTQGILGFTHETFAAETRMLLRAHPPYPRRTYAGDHRKLVEALRRRDPRTPDLVAEHLRLTSRLIGGEAGAEPVES